jgi:hypothetical protein
MKKVLLLLSMVVLMPSGSVLMADPAATTSPNLIEQAEAARKEADTLGYEWRDTAKLIKSAKEALENGQKEESDKLASQALLQARAATAQAKFMAKNWKMMIPE